MKKKILIVHFSMDLGGAETSLIGLLKSIDYSRYQVDMLLLNPSGDLFDFIPKEVNILPTPKQYFDLTIGIKDVLLKGDISITFARLLAKVKMLGKKTGGYMLKQYSHINSMPFLPKIKGEYDMAISFIDPHYIIEKKANAKIKLGWLHTDYSIINCDLKQDKKMWDGLDYVVNVSDACKRVFDNMQPDLKHKSIVIENILAKDFLISQSNELNANKEFNNDNCIKLLSIGRFAEAKNFDNVPNICKRLLESGLDVIWYIIGYGGDENKIKNKIIENKMEDHVIMLGKKTNPYPYIKACDYYIQPSRYEGKAVTVREAQILCKPVVITNFATASSQLTDGVDGVIVPMDNEGCAEGIVDFIKNKELQTNIVHYLENHDYTNSSEIEKLYKLMED